MGQEHVHAIQTHCRIDSWRYKWNLGGNWSWARGIEGGVSTIGVDDLESAKIKCLDEDMWSYGVVAPLLSVREGELPVPAIDGGH